MTAMNDAMDVSDPPPYDKSIPYERAHTMDDIRSVTSQSSFTSLYKNQYSTSNGNYRGYYKFREQQLSENLNRIAGFQASWFYEQRVLDIGCNEGTLTMLIAKEFNPLCVIGIDIDKRLIEAAGSAVKRAIYDYRVKRKSTMKAILETNENQSHIRQPTNLFLPRKIALTRPMFQGQQIINSSPSDNNNGKYPFNVFFQCGDILDAESITHGQGYGVILCMSVSKWVHLNHGDSGLMRFFHLLFSITIPGGKVIVEYQPWKSYINNKSASENIKFNFKQIKIRPDDFERILSEEVGFTVLSRLGTSLENAKGFRRPILVLQKPLPQLARISWRLSKVGMNQEEDISFGISGGGISMEETIASIPVSSNIAAPSVNENENSSTDKIGGTRDLFGVKRNMSYPNNVGYLDDEDIKPANAVKRFRVGI